MATNSAEDYLPPGYILAGKYSIIRVLGQGGMGVVYEAVHQGLGQRVAIKMLRGDASSSEEAQARFEREARAAARLRSPHVARVTDVGTTAEGLPFMVMEYLEGRDLGWELEARGRVEVGEAVDHVLQACRAMSEAHAMGIVHRDLKPENLFLCEHRGENHIKVLDFGISKMVVEGEVRVTQTQSALGTPVYMSPEQIRSAKKVDARSDIWALGVILYELLIGEVPFEGESLTAVVASITVDTITPPIELRPEIPKALSDAVMMALERNANDRFQDVDSFAATISPFAERMRWTKRQPLLTPGGLVPSEPQARGIDTGAETVLSMVPPAPGGRDQARTQGSWSQHDGTSRAASRRGPLLAVAAVLLLVAGGASAVLWGGGDDTPTAPASSATPGPIGTSTATASAAAPPASVPSAPAPAPASADAPEPAPAPVAKPTPRPHPTIKPVPKAKPDPKPVPKPVVKPAPVVRPKPAGGHPLHL